MYSPVDMHIHSKESDGRLDIYSILGIMRERGTTLASISNHDTVKGLAYAAKLGRQYGITFVKGVELSVRYKGNELHLLGYDFDDEDTYLNKVVDELTARREQRVTEISKRVNVELERYSLPILTSQDIEEIKRSADGSVGRPHIARHLVKLGYAANQIDAFHTYLSKCDIQKKVMSVEDARKMMDSSGGYLFIAHPNGRGFSLRQFAPRVQEQLSTLRELLPLLDGVECYCDDHTFEECRMFSDFAKVNGKMISLGSDCHQDPVKIGTVLAAAEDEKIMLSQFPEKKNG